VITRFGGEIGALHPHELKRTGQHQQALNAMHAKLNLLVPIPTEEWDFFSLLTSHRIIAKNSCFVQMGESIVDIGFCVNGLFRLYYTTADGNEFNKNFCTNGDFVTCYSALLQNVPAFFSIQALANSSLITVEYRHFQSLRTRHICWEQLARLVAEMLYLHKETRERELLLLSAEERYLRFMRRFGPLADQIPLYHAASYLGITPVALSRIRRRLNLG
jgi:CRP-like cAMP-binding protein